MNSMYESSPVGKADGKIISLEERDNVISELALKNDDDLRATGNGLRDKILSQKDLYKILPFGKRKIQKLIEANQLPLVKVGRDYITTFDVLENWIRENVNLEIYYE